MQCILKVFISNFGSFLLFLFLRWDMNALKDLHIGVCVVYTPHVYTRMVVYGGMAKPMNCACALQVTIRVVTGECIKHTSCLSGKINQLRRCMQQFPHSMWPPQVRAYSFTKIGFVLTHYKIKQLIQHLVIFGQKNRKLLLILVKSRLGDDGIGKIPRGQK